MVWMVTFQVAYGPPFSALWHGGLYVTPFHLPGAEMCACANDRVWARAQSILGGYGGASPAKNLPQASMIEPDAWLEIMRKDSYGKKSGFVVHKFFGLVLPGHQGPKKHSRPKFMPKLVGIPLHFLEPNIFFADFLPIGRPIIESKTVMLSGPVLRDTARLS